MRRIDFLHRETHEYDPCNINTYFHSQFSFCSTGNRRANELNIRQQISLIIFMHL